MYWKIWTIFILELTLFEPLCRFEAGVIGWIILYCEQTKEKTENKAYWKSLVDLKRTVFWILATAYLPWNRVEPKSGHTGGCKKFLFSSKSEVPMACYSPSMDFCAFHEIPERIVTVPERVILADPIAVKSFMISPGIVSCNIPPAGALFFNIRIPE